jgi:Protein of unknown function, DUF488
VKHQSRTVVLTVGHSTRPLAEFIALLSSHSVSRLIDVRTVPRSRHNPQFNRDTLPVALEGAGIRYAHAPGLGGFRHTHPGSLNMGWRNGIRAEEITNATRLQVHTLTSFAHVDGVVITYPPQVSSP